MEKKNTKIVLNVAIVAILIIILGGSLGLFAVTGNESLSRSVPSTVSPGQTFTVTYTATGTSGTWGNSIEDSVSGGCKFPSGSSTYKTVMLSDDGNTKSIQITSPQSGQCVFTGDVKFGESAVKNMPNSVVTISSNGGGDPTCTGSSNQACAIANGVGQQTRTCSSGTWGSWGTCTAVSCSSGYKISGNTCIVDSGNGGNGGTYEPPTFDLDQVVFNLGGFAVTIKLLLIILGALFFLRLFMGK
jgi:hypothetical protein